MMMLQRLPESPNVSSTNIAGARQNSALLVNDLGLRGAATFPCPPDSDVAAGHVLIHTSGDAPATNHSFPLSGWHCAPAMETRIACDSNRARDEGNEYYRDGRVRSRSREAYSEQTKVSTVNNLQSSLEHHRQHTGESTGDAHPPRAAPYSLLQQEQHSQSIVDSDTSPCIQPHESASSAREQQHHKSNFFSNTSLSPESSHDDCSKSTAASAEPSHQPSVYQRSSCLKEIDAAAVRVKAAEGSVPKAMSSSSKSYSAVSHPCAPTNSCNERIGGKCVAFQKDLTEEWASRPLHQRFHRGYRAEGVPPSSSRRVAVSTNKQATQPKQHVQRSISTWNAGSNDSSSPPSKTSARRNDAMEPSSGWPAPPPRSVANSRVATRTPYSDQIIDYARGLPCPKRVRAAFFSVAEVTGKLDLLTPCCFGIAGKNVQQQELSPPSLVVHAHSSDGTVAAVDGSTSDSRAFARLSRLKKGGDSRASDDSSSDAVADGLQWVSAAVLGEARQKRQAADKSISSAADFSSSVRSCGGDNTLSPPWAGSGTNIVMQSSEPDEMSELSSEESDSDEMEDGEVEDAAARHQKEKSLLFLGASGKKTRVPFSALTGCSTAPSPSVGITQWATSRVSRGVSTADGSLISVIPKVADSNRQPLPHGQPPFTSNSLNNSNVLAHSIASDISCSPYPSNSLPSSVALSTSEAPNSLSEMNAKSSADSTYAPFAMDNCFSVEGEVSKNSWPTHAVSTLSPPVSLSSSELPSSEISASQIQHRADISSPLQQTRSDIDVSYTSFGAARASDDPFLSMSDNKSSTLTAVETSNATSSSRRPPLASDAHHVGSTVAAAGGEEARGKQVFEGKSNITDCSAHGTGVPTSAVAFGSSGPSNSRPRPVDPRLARLSKSQQRESAGLDRDSEKKKPVEQDITPLENPTRAVSAPFKPAATIIEMQLKEQEGRSGVAVTSDDMEPRYHVCSIDGSRIELRPPKCPPEGSLPPSLAGTCVARGKLPLLLDLDNTLLHAQAAAVTGCDVRLEDWLDKDGEPELFKFELPCNRKSYYMKLRPHLRTFLRVLAPYYEMSVYTNATQEYADIVVAILDEDRQLFSDRIVARNSGFRGETSENKAVRRLYENMDKRCIVAFDDRQNIWTDLPLSHVVKAQHYDFFDSHRAQLNSYYGPLPSGNGLACEVDGLGRVNDEVSRGGDDLFVGTPDSQQQMVKSDVQSSKSMGVAKKPCDWDRHLDCMLKLFFHVHTEFFKDPANANIGAILSNIQQRVLSGVGIFFTGYRKTLSPGAAVADCEERQAELAQRLGARVYKRFDEEGVTHVVAGKNNTNNMLACRDNANLARVHTLWLYCCEAALTRVPETAFDADALCAYYKNGPPTSPYRDHWMHLAQGQESIDDNVKNEGNSTRDSIASSTLYQWTRTSNSAHPVLPQDSLPVREFLGTGPYSDGATLTSPYEEIVFIWRPDKQTVRQLYGDEVRGPSTGGAIPLVSSELADRNSSVLLMSPTAMSLPSINGSGIGGSTSVDSLTNLDRQYRTANSSTGGSPGISSTMSASNTGCLLGHGRCSQVHLGLSL